MALTLTIQIRPPIFRQLLKSKFQRPILSHQYYCTATYTPQVVSRDKECDDFLPWLENKAGTNITSVLSIGKSAYGRSLFASKKIQAGDTILRVPFNAQITRKNLPPEIDTLIGNEVEVDSTLAVFLLYEQRKGQNSEWAPYVTRLPQPAEMHMTVLWSEDELHMIRESSVYQETINLQALLKREFSAIKPVLDRFPEKFGDVTFDDFIHAFCLVNSRGWVSDSGISLIPFADFFNHKGTSKSSLSHDESERYSEVTADRDYNPGEEVFIRYAKFPNSTLLFDFGFTVPLNKYDQVRFQVDIPSHDDLRAKKLELLHQHRLPKSKDASVTSSGCSFVIKKLMSSSGKGKGFPQSLRAFARVMCCTSLQELDDLVGKATQSDGRLARKPLVSRSMELLAHQSLFLLINEWIEKYNASIKSLVSESTVNCSKLAVRRHMALDLLIGELDILRSASSWLKKYCHSIKSNA